MTQSLNSDPKINKAARELEFWINNENTPLPNHIANIHKQHLGLHFAKHEDHGEFINQWVRLGTRQELAQVGSLREYMLNCLDKFVSR